MGTMILIYKGSCTNPTYIGTIKAISHVYVDYLSATTFNVPTDFTFQPSFCGVTYSPTFTQVSPATTTCDLATALKSAFKVGTNPTAVTLPTSCKVESAAGTYSMKVKLVYSSSKG